MPKSLIRNLLWMGIVLFPMASAADTSDIPAIRAAAEKGDATAQAKLGMAYYKGNGAEKNYTEAAKWTQKAAEQGNVYAESLLGIMYVNGEGVPQNNAEAAKWYQRAADQGYAVAEDNLAAMYHEGSGVPKDIAKSAALYRAAAEQGDAGAQVALAYILLQDPSNVVPKDYVQGYMWLILAADQRSTKAVEMQNSIKAHLKPEQLAEAQQRAQAWKQQHSPR